jgi:hypothetical protein
VHNISFNPDNAREGELPPWEVAKAYAFKFALDAIAEHTGTPAPELVGERVDAWIAKQVTVKGGGHPTARAMRSIFVRHGFRVGQTFRIVHCLTMMLDLVSNVSFIL